MLAHFLLPTGPVWFYWFEGTRYKPDRLSIMIMNAFGKQTYNDCVWDHLIKSNADQSKVVVTGEVELWDAFDLYTYQKPVCAILSCCSNSSFPVLLFLKAAYLIVPPYGRWGGWCVWARPSLLAHHIPGDKVWRPGHTNTWPCPGTIQRHASLGSRRGAQTTLLRWGWWHTVFQKRKKRNIVLWMISSVIKLKYETILWDLWWEMANYVAALILFLAPDSRDYSGFYGLHGVYPAASLFKRRQTGIETGRTWQRRLPA